MTFDKSTRFCIVGLGQIGGCYSKLLCENGFEVGGIDISKDSVEYAVENGFIRHGKTEPDAQYLKDFDVLVFALYPTVFEQWIKDNQKYLKSGALLTDVTGVKSCIIDKIQGILREDLEFIGAHPMAGREKGGIRTANTEVFKGANYIITPTEKNTPKAIAQCEELGRILGFGTVTTLTPKEHDSMIAFLSQLTHCIAVALMTCRDTSAMAEYSGDSFRDLTRIAKINEKLWSELFLLNKEELLQQMTLFEESFSKLRRTIEQDDKEGMCEIMRYSAQQRELFDKRRNTK